MDEDIEAADIITSNTPFDDEEPVDSYYGEAPEEVYEKPTRRGRPREKTIEKNKVIKYILREIAERLSYIHNRTFQTEIKRETILIGKKLDELAEILDVKK